MARISASVGRRGVNRRPDVVTVKYLINAHIDSIRPIAPLMINGNSDQRLIEAIDAFQRQVAGMASPDGRVDPRGRTLRALNRLPATRNLYYYPTGPQEPLADIARRYIGATETGNNRMGNDPRMREIFEADYARISRSTTDGYAWCSSFVSLCTQKLIANSMLYRDVRPPREASVSRFLNLWAPTQKCNVFPPSDSTYRPNKGDIVVFRFSHIGIVDTVGSGQVRTIEGNTNEAGSREGTTVRQKDRPFSVIRSFIRLPIPIAYDVVNQVCVAPA
jgi:hypothetical protein